MRAAADYLDGSAHAWHRGLVELRDGRIRLTPDVDTSHLPRIRGVVTGGFTDAHVHLQLVDPAALADSVLGRVIDLGGDPAALSAVHHSAENERSGPESPRTADTHAISAEFCALAFAGAFLTPPGGYPSDRAWAPRGSVREIADADAAATAVAEMQDAGATRIKVASNSTAGPVFTDDMFTTIVQLAASHGLPVVAHAEGPGEAQRVARLGARTLAHAPFTERLDEDELRRMRDLDVSWISTLGIHGGETLAIAIDNVRRFHAIGGTIQYGTDMGNGPTPVDLNAGEITALRKAGIDGMELLRALAPTDPLHRDSRLLFFPGASPDDADPLIARPLTAADLENPR